MYHIVEARIRAALADVLRQRGVDDVPVVFSETSFVLPLGVQPASMPCGKGALGADLLRHCTLVWGWSSLWAACHAPAEGD